MAVTERETPDEVQTRIRILSGQYEPTQEEKQKLKILDPINWEIEMGKIGQKKKKMEERMKNKGEQAELTQEEKQKRETAKIERKRKWEERMKIKAEQAEMTQEENRREERMEVKVEKAEEEAGHEWHRPWNAEKPSKSAAEMVGLKILRRLDTGADGPLTIVYDDMGKPAAEVVDVKDFRRLDTGADAPFTKTKAEQAELTQEENRREEGMKAKKTGEEAGDVDKPADEDGGAKKPGSKYVMNSYRWITM